MITEHSFNVLLAEKVGVNAAILYKNLEFWITKNKANGTNFIDGYYWTYNSNQAFLKLFPYMGKKAIENALNKLRDEGLIEWERNFNPENKHDSTRYFRLTCEGYSEIPQRGTSVSPKGELVNRTDINTDINTDIKTKAKKVQADLPEWLDLQAWGNWVQHRREIKKPLTSAAIKLQLNLLERNKFTHAEIIKQSIQNGWTGLFKLKNNNYKAKEPEVGSLDWMAAQSAKRSEDIEAEVL